MTQRTDVHQHLIPDFYRAALHGAGLTEAGGRGLPDWSPDQAIQLMDLLGTRAAIVSISTPGVAVVTSPGHPWTASLRSLPISCSTRRARRTCSCATTW